MSNIETNEVDETQDAPQGVGEPGPEGSASEAAAPEGTDTEEAVVAEVVEPELSREEELEAEVAKLRDQLMRTAADFDNFRKRARKDVEDAQRKGLERALLEVLPVSDNLERALSHVDANSDVQAVIEGVQMVLRSLEDSLERLGVERLVATGQPFDPNIHEAIQQVPTAEAAPGTIVSELVPGYRLGPKLLRAAMVAVAKAAPQSESSENEPN